LCIFFANPNVISQLRDRRRVVACVKTRRIFVFNFRLNLRRNKERLKRSNEHSFWGAKEMDTNKHIKIIKIKNPALPAQQTDGAGVGIRFLRGLESGF
jgi:hypothetical protein